MVIYKKRQTSQISSTKVSEKWHVGLVRRGLDFKEDLKLIELRFHSTKQ